ncbi:hypothetical protein TBLA_0A07610 [Henningerozyma blattae CBS 6284]|uniref:Peroxisomal membrane protein PEX13 n=1 Tax=Henningerozyma blattae (strain ATCC 34711 / CBS 6284 / DSM 70876 / NBRC 10599 / NRRL Y-10934 / UCD 77-7) TaxID=1071380 RepID=I2GWP9_HENB6|nr:hypothetical protein TBLA_0A07610 [Tetrapisispora blattae CBS 6284]CCH58551.1 hypothetical protein TBLA_0A07610 [Tetrapisispora blattae CBS 6284]
MNELNTAHIRPKPWEMHPPLDEIEQTNKRVDPSAINDGGSTSIENIINNNQNTESRLDINGNPIHEVDSPPSLPANRPEFSSPNNILDQGINSNRFVNESSYMPGTNLYGGNSYLNNGMYGGNSYNSMYGGNFTNTYGNPYGSLFNNGFMNRNSEFERFGDSTQSTFQLIESLIGAVAGFAQMLESTYMATHNSFFTMISVAEQFSYIKELLGSFFGIFTIMKLLKKLLYLITGGRLGLSPNSKNNTVQSLMDDFSKFNSDEASYSNSDAIKHRRLSLKPLIFFLSAVFGFPYILNKFIKKLESSQRRNLAYSNSTSQSRGDIHSLDPSRLEFGRALYDFIPENPRIEATMKKGELLAILDRRDVFGNESEWWKVRTKNGSTGYVPYNYIEIIRRIETDEENIPGLSTEDINA